MKRGKRVNLGTLLHSQVAHVPEHEVESGVSRGRLTYQMPQTKRYQAAFALARAREDFKAQHGPVKVLYKDGKPVSPLT